MRTQDPEALRRSPLDDRSAEEPVPATVAEDPILDWLPSRYNVRATADDGRLILWNTYRGSMCAVPAHEVERIRPLLAKAGFRAPRVGVVEYLADRGFLVLEGDDELERLRFDVARGRFRTDRLELTLLSSEDCNFRCKYCYEDFPRGTMLPRVRTAVRRYVEGQLQRLSSLSVNWFGGEPLYGLEAVDELAPYFQQACAERGVAYRGSMTTNGYLFTPDVAQRLLDWDVRSFQITLDGPRESHDRSRPTRLGGPSFQRIFDNLAAVATSDRTFHVLVRVNFDRENAPHLGKLVEALAASMAGDRRFTVMFYPVDRWGGDNDAALGVCSAEEKEAVERDLGLEASRLGLQVSNRLGWHRLGSSVCYAARPNHFIVGATGKLMKCTIALDQEDYNVVGHLSDEGEMVLDTARLSAWTRPVADEHPRCRKCVFLPVCQAGACPKARITQGQPKCISARFRPKEELLQVFAHNPVVREIRL